MRTLLSVVLLLTLTGTASAIVYSSSRTKLSQGAGFDVVGADFSVPIRAKLTMEKRSIPVRVARGATSSQFTATLVTFPRGVHGDCVLSVKTKGSKVASHLAGLSIELPLVTDVQPRTASVGAEVTITGSYFGNKPTRVSIGGVRATVTKWSDGEIRFLVPRKVTPEAHFVDVTSRAGLTAGSIAITVE
jgi:hypothetical protein